MTPTAVTPAARQNRAATPRPAPVLSSTPRANPRSPLPRSAMPRTPRRVSGPARSIRETAVTGVPRSPRRISGPARPARAGRGATRTPAPPLSARGLAVLRSLPDHALLDRVVRGRLWIPLLGVLLAGIVAMQVEVLKLNAGIGHAMVRSSQLQTENQLLQANVSQLADDQRIESMAAKMGMTMAPPSSARFLSTGGAASLARALADIHTPDAAGFAVATRAYAAAAAASTTATTASSTVTGG